MNKHWQQGYTATCEVQHQIIDPESLEKSWVTYETMDVSALTLEQLSQNAYMYIGKPEDVENTLAIKLTGTATLMNQEQSPCHEHKNTMSIQFHILRERNTPLYHDNLVPMRAAREKQGERIRNRFTVSQNTN